MTISFEVDEDVLKDLFDNCEVKYSKKKAKELIEDLDETEDDIQLTMQDLFEEIVAERIQELFE